MKNSQKHQVTGQLIVRETGMAAKNAGLEGDDKDLFMVFGVIAVPKDSLKGEHQYPVVGTSEVTTVSLNMMRLMANNVEEKTKGASPGGLLLQPMWQV
jgi:hypothetical protein